MSRILHQNSKGITIVRDDFKRRSQVKVYSGFPENKYCIRTYRFDFIQDPIEIPYNSWANLDCCGGWAYDEEYLNTAVQNGLKLFAGISHSLKHIYTPDYPTREEALRQFRIFKDSLPADIFADVEDQQSGSAYLNTFICRIGSISDYINLDTVFEFYEKLGHYVSASEKKEVEHLCACEMKLYGTDRAPFSYSQAGTTAEFITTGLLLGYPIESTVSVLHGN